jgi:hypothetical protein
MILVVDLNDTGIISSITSPHCTTWNVVDTAVRGGVIKKVVYWCLANGTGTDTIKITFSTAQAYPDSSYLAYTGVTTLDQHTNANGSNTTCAVGPTGTTTANNELVFVSCSDGNPITWPNGTTGYTQEPAASSAYLSTQDKTVTSTGTQSFSVTSASLTTWVGVIATFK